MLLRQTNKKDAPNILEVIHGAEASGFMLFEPNERKLTPNSLSKSNLLHKKY